MLHEHNLQNWVTKLLHGQQYTRVLIQGLLNGVQYLKLYGTECYHSQVGKDIERSSCDLYSKCEILRVSQL
jgi:hypothetical protein